MLDDGVDVACASREGYTALHARSESDGDCVASLRAPRLRAGRACGRDEPRRLFGGASTAARYDAADALAVLIEELGASSDLRSRSGDGPRARRGALRQRAGAQVPRRPAEPREGQRGHRGGSHANNNGALPLHCAAARDQQACVECLVSRFSASVNAQDASGATPLHWASYYGSVASIRCLGSNGADADAVRTADGARALPRRGRRRSAICASSACAGAVGLGGGARRTRRTRRALGVRVLGTSPHCFVCIRNLGPMSTQETSGERRPLCWQQARARCRVPERVVDDLGADCNLTDEDGATATHHAAAHGRADALAVLPPVADALHVAAAE